MLDKLMDAGAKVVVFDLVYASETPGDNDFANALLKYKDHMLIGEDFAQISDVEFSLTTPNDRLLLPGSESIVGLVNISGDADGIIRHAKYQTSLEREDGMSGFPDDLTHITVLAVKKFNGKTVIPPDKALHPAAVNGIFSMPDVLRTGPDSRAELEATDGTITRVGANTIFSFEPASRTIHLEQGSLLFHSPHGKGGGTIQTGSATASVIGTTIIVTCTPSGGFKLLDLEGQAEVRYLDGLKQTLEPGQLTFILPGGSVSPVIVFRLDTETKGSALVSGFATPLDSQSKINSEITQHLLQVLNGTAADTGYVVGNSATVNSVQVLMDNINNTPQPSTTPPPPVFSTDGSIIGSDHVNNLVDANGKALLPKNYPPIDSAHTFDSSITPLTADEMAGIDSVDSFSQGLSFLGLAAPASGFFGNNIDIDTANIDLSSFASKSDFDIMAKGDLNVWQSVDFNDGASLTAGSGTQLPELVSLIADGQMLIASGATLEADTGTFGLVADSFGVLNPAGGTSLYPNILWNDNIYNTIGDIDILSLSDLQFDGGNVQANGEVNIEGESSLIFGGPDGEEIIEGGGSVYLTAGGDLEIANNYPDSYPPTEVYSDYGDVNIIAAGAVNISDSDVDGGYHSDSGGTVNITGMSVSVLDNSEIYAYDDVNITSQGASPDGDAIDMENSEIYAGYNYNSDGANNSSAGGSVNITANNGDAYLDYDDIKAYSGAISDGDVNIFASGTADIEDTYIEADGNVNIESGNTLYLGWNSGGDQIDAGGSISLTSDNGDMDVSGYDFYPAGDLDFSAGVGETVDKVYAEIGGNLNVNASGDVNVTGSYFDLYNGGSVGMTAVGNIDIIDTGGSGNASLSFNAGGYVNVHDSANSDLSINQDLTIGNWTVAAGNYVDLSADGNLTIENSDISAAGGDVTVSAGGNLTTGTQADVSIFADGDISVYGHDGAHLDYTTADAGGKIALESYYDVSVDNSGLTADTKDADIYADHGNVDFEHSTAKATLGNVDIEAGRSDTSGSETLTLVGDTVLAGGTVTLAAQSDVDVDQDVSDTTALTAGGDVYVISVNGNVDMENSAVLAGGSVALNAAGSVTLNSGSVTTANKIVNVNAGTGITINGVAVTADDPTYGSIVLASTSGQTTIQNGSSVAGNLTVNSPDGILIDGSQGGTFSGNKMSLTAGSGDANGGPVISVQNADLSGYATVNMAAHTVNLLDVAFGGSSTVNLHSYFGALAANPNTGQTSVPGYVNFINGVTYGGEPAQNHIGSGITISGL